MRRSSIPISLACTLALAAPTASRAQSRSIDWPALARETQQVLADYLRVNTTNPPGNELAGARFLKAILDREGIEAQILDSVELGAGRANLYARLRGNGSKKAIALVHHIDVVPAAASFWSVDPYGGVVKDGYLWGRGALDMKGQGIAHLMAMLAIKRSGMPLSRDIVYIANTDEEVTSTGAIVFVNRHAELLRDVEYLVTEGGDNFLDRSGKIQYFGVGVAEKRTFWQRLTVKGIPSHGSRPTRHNPVPRLVAALNRIASYETPLRATPGVQKFFRDIARLYPEPQRGWLSDISRALQEPRAKEWILSDVYWNAILRNTIALTALTGSDRTNVIPPEATADLDIRILPDQDADEMLAILKRIAGDTAVHFTPLLAPKTPLENPVDTDLFRAIETASARAEPGSFVTTRMLTAATDRPTYRKLGIITYGLDPFRVPAEESQRGMHGNDERISLENLGFGVRFLYDILRNVQ
ncbi:MAG TPA: M20/M25/M40 family metallo-hydrolase [Gemmatimonadaceae bacterium]|nr:M20/M25/M40 family metallo-hydrolase [Gemmatimonadaceae bacterium]